MKNHQELIDQAITLQAAGMHIEAAMAFDEALYQSPELFDQFNSARYFSAWNGFKAAQDTSSWQHYDRLQRLVHNAVTQGMWVIGEMTLAAPMLSNLDLLSLTTRHGRSVLADLPDFTPFEFTTKPADARIKIGFVGADFYGQATAYLLTQAIAQIDRSQFEVIAYDYGLTNEDPLRELSKAAYDQLISIHNLSDDEAAQRIYDDQIDVLFSIKNPASARLGIFARRPAPLQVHYLYFPGTSGMPFFDGFVADNIVVPPEFEYAYSEKIWRIDGCYQPNDDQRMLAIDMSKADWGLPEDKIVLANMSQNYKITPSIFDAWMRILIENDNCVLWLLESTSDVASDNLRLEAQQRGVNPNRLYFSPPLGSQQHLTRLRTADIVLDTFPYGGHTLTSDALWAGTPVVTLIGDTYASRVPASLLANVGLADLITYSYDGYVRAINALIHDHPRRAYYRQHLDHNRHTFDLFNSTSYARRFEKMIRRYARPA